VMMLVQQGDVGLDDPISQYLPAFENAEVIATFNAQDKTFTRRPATTDITVRHLLTHTSGLGYSFSSPVLAALLGSAPGASATTVPLLHDPGTKWTYGESTRVLGSLVEEVSGQPLDQFLAERIFVPLGMSDTFYVVPAAKAARVVTTFRTTPEGFVETPNPEQVSSPIYGDGGLHSTAADYVKFMQMFLNDGRAPDGKRILSEESVKLMGRTQTGNVRVELQPTANEAVSMTFPLGASRDAFGLGFQVTGAHNDPGERSPGSMAWAGIFNTQFWIDPARGVSAVLLMQYLPFYDATAIETLQGFERRVYESLAD
jgi:methyl acetate hydrolase